MGQNNLFKKHFGSLTDPRINRKKRHLLMDITALSICAVIAGADGWEAIQTFGEAKYEWLKSFLLLPNGIPSHDTIRRVFARLSPKELQERFCAWMEEVAQLLVGEVIAIDGKTLRHSFKKVEKEKKGAIHMISAWAASNGVVLAQLKTEEKSNEITAIPELLKLLSVEKCLVTIDAMGCQTKIAKQIIDDGGDYILTVKDNQKTLHEDIVDFFKYAQENNFKNVNHDYFEEIDAGHGRIETRKYWQTDYLGCIGKRADWKGLKSIGFTESIREIDGAITTEYRCYILSIGLNAKRFGNAVRAHWGIENSLHWVLDMTFREDDSRIREGHAPENFAVLRHIAINQLKKEKTFVRSIKQKRYRAAMDTCYLAKVIAA